MKLMEIVPFKNNIDLSRDKKESSRIELTYILSWNETIKQTWIKLNLEMVEQLDFLINAFNCVAII